MGYRRPAYMLQFEDPQFEGLEVRCKGLPFGQLLELIEFAGELAPETLTPQSREKLEDLTARFGEVILSWNLEDDEGNPIPATVQGFQSTDFAMQIAIILAYVEGVTSVASPLGRRSRSGREFPEASIPMEVSLESPTSSPEHS